MKYYIVIISFLGFIKCGKVPLRVNGAVAEIKHFPHSAFLRVQCSKTQGYICGASIVNQRVLLTAAHCVTDCHHSNGMTIFAGHHQVSKALMYSVDKVFAHKDYRKQNFKHDIGLISLKKNLKFGYAVSRVAIMKNPPYFEKAHVAGWGQLTENVPINKKTLFYIDQYVWPPRKCRNISKHLPRGVICASSRKSNSFILRGDSGSALVVKGYIQIGVVSFQVISAGKSMTVYTDTSYHYDWIKEFSEKFYCWTGNKANLNII